MNATDRPAPPRVVVVGAGMAGLATVRALSRAPVTVELIDSHNYTTFAPLLFQVATCFISPAEVARPIRALLRRGPAASFRMGRVVDVDWRDQRVLLDDGDAVGFEGRHSATRIHPEIPPLQPGDTVPMGAGAFAPVSEVEPYRHLVAQETYVLRPLPGNRTRLIARYRGAGFVSPAARAIEPDAGRLPRLLRFAVLHVPGVDLALRGFDFFISDLVHHYMETGMLTGIKARAEGKYSHASNDDAAATAVEPVAATG